MEIERFTPGFVPDNQQASAAKRQSEYSSAKASNRELNEAVTFSEDLSSRESSNEIEKNENLKYLEKVLGTMQKEGIKYDSLGDQDKEYVNTALTNYAKDLSGDAQDAEIGATKEKYAEIYNKIMS